MFLAEILLELIFAAPAFKFRSLEFSSRLFRFKFCEFRLILSATTLPARLMLPLASRSILLAITKAEAFTFLSLASFLNLLMLSFLASYKPSRIFAI